MSKYWQRKFELRLIDSQQQGLVLSDLKVSFEINWNQFSTPRDASITIYNLSQTTLNQLLNEQYSRIEVYAGYAGTSTVSGAKSQPVVPASLVKRPQAVAGPGIEPGFGQIFGGDLRAAKLSATSADTSITLQVKDGFRAYIGAHSKAALAKGYRMVDAVNILMEPLIKEYGIKAGHQFLFPTSRAPRGINLDGPVSEHLNDLMKYVEAREQKGKHPYWQIIDGQLHILNDDMHDGTVITLNAASGIIGRINRVNSGSTNSGILEVTTLINPAIRLGQRIKIEGDLTASGDQLFIKANNEEADPQARLDTDGIYIVRGLNYKGDTRDSTWDMKITCQAQSDPGVPDIQNTKKTPG
ncbi:hypothetical protein TUM12370_09390 [Salmonella enterica subsp. enterica serovar Choleraesuis]|nr:hypothetical protein TUM12370_09390 [Salmonella enterica subsp. enterica serovar Choleraesuis]